MPPVLRLKGAGVTVRDRGSELERRRQSFLQRTGSFGVRKESRNRRNTAECQRSEPPRLVRGLLRLDFEASLSVRSYSASSSSV
jgi:hypothetical protein